jgi:hypothetical protein
VFGFVTLIAWTSAWTQTKKTDAQIRQKTFPRRLPRTKATVLVRTTWTDEAIGAVRAAPTAVLAARCPSATSATSRSRWWTTIGGVVTSSSSLASWLASWNLSSRAEQIGALIGALVLLPVALLSVWIALVLGYWVARLGGALFALFVGLTGFFPGTVMVGAWLGARIGKGVSSRTTHAPRTG